MTLRIAALLAVLLPTVLSAQRSPLQGRVVDRLLGTPVPGAIVDLYRGDTLVVTRTTDSRGAWIGPARAADGLMIRVRAIGFAPFGPISLTELPEQGREIALIRFAIELPPIDASSQQRCGREPGHQDDLLSTVILAAQVALETVEAPSRKLGEAGEGVAFVVTRTREETLATTAPPNLWVADPRTVSVDTIRTWPLHGAREEILQVTGFVRTVGAEIGRMYFAPDAATLFDPWFLEHHCFSVSITSSDSVYQLRFEPIRGRADLPLLAGAIHLDRQTLAPLRLEWEYRQVASWIENGMAGGSMSFVQSSPGVWYPATWHIRAPMESRSRSRLPSGPIVANVVEIWVVNKVLRTGVGRGDQ